MATLFLTIMFLSLLVGIGAVIYSVVCEQAPTLITSIYICFISVIGIAMSHNYVKYEKTPENNQAMIRTVEEKNP